MSERTGLGPNVERAGFVLLMLAAIYVPLLPFGIDRSGPVLPDLCFVLTAAWVLRRPDTAPLLIIAALALLGDVLLSRPLGLWAVLMVLGSEFLRSQAESLRDEMFVLEWLTVGGVLLAMTSLNLLVLTIALVPLPDTDLLLAHVGVTLAAYPVVAAFLHWVVRVRAPKPTDRFAGLRGNG